MQHDVSVETLPRIRPRMLAAATIGNALEFYDFLSYVFFATSIAAVFFPNHDHATQLLLALGTFGVSFLARPVGALVLGAYADRRGRVACMMLSIGLMTLGSAMMTVMPGYRSIGVAAPFGILIARLIQGFSLGGEFGSSTALMIEQARGGEARAASWQGTGQILAGTLALGIAWLLSTLLSHPAYQQWGFRIAFGIGVLGGPVALLLRRHLGETLTFSGLRSGAVRPPAESATVRRIFLAVGLVALQMGQTYVVVYLPTYAAVHLHMSNARALGAIFLLYAVMLLLTPVRLAIASRFDRSHRFGAMLGSCLLLMICGYPAFSLLDAYPTPIMLFLVPFLLSIVGIFYASPLQALMGLVFHQRRRGLGLSVSYSVGVAVFGGFAPFITTWMITLTGDARSPGLYLTATGVITMLALLLARRQLTEQAMESVRPG